jgi:hypothetical protein
MAVNKPSRQSAANRLIFRFILVSDNEVFKTHLSAKTSIFARLFQDPSKYGVPDQNLKLILECKDPD